METRSSANSSDTRPLLPKPPITIVILTWNALDYTKGCLESLRAYTDYPDYRVIVADNGSSDGTIEYLRSLPWVKVLLNGDNLGFAAGNNRAIRIADPASDVVLLNNDTELHQPDWLARLQACAYASPDIGVVGCRRNSSFDPLTAGKKSITAVSRKTGILQSATNVQMQDRARRAASRVAG